MINRRIKAPRFGTHEGGCVQGKKEDSYPFDIFEGFAGLVVVLALLRCRFAVGFHRVVLPLRRLNNNHFFFLILELDQHHSSLHKFLNGFKLPVCATSLQHPIDLDSIQTITDLNFKSNINFVKCKIHLGCDGIFGRGFSNKFIK